MVRETVFQKDAEKRIDVGALLRTETPVAWSLQGRAEDTASSPRNGAEARLGPRYEETRDTLSLAFHAKAVSRDAGSLVEQKRAERLRQLVAADGAPPEFVIDVYVIAYRGGAGKRFYHPRGRIDGLLKILDARPVSERLQASGCGTGPDSDEISRSFADLYDVAPLAFRGYGAFHEGDIKMSPEGPVCDLPEIGNLEQPDEVQKFLLQIQNRELATVAGGEFENADSRLFHFKAPLFP